MGNCLSASDTVSLRDLFDRPGASAAVSLTEKHITDGLNAVAAQLAKDKLNISIVAVGGAVNALYLRSRSTTSDVDFFYRTKTKDQNVTRVISAAEGASKKLGLDKQWLNNHTAVFIEVGC